jgi:para-nitrobenzyl esterase
MSRERANQLAQKLLDHLGLKWSDAHKLQELSWRDLRRASRDVTRLTGLRFSPVLDACVFSEHPWDPEAPETAREIPMLIGTCRTELSNQLGNEATFALDHAGLRERLQAFLPARDIERVIAVFEQESPGATPAELFFKITTARGYFRDSVLQTEAKARQAGAPVYAYRLMWKTPIEGGRRITPHSLDLPFMFDNVARAPHMVGPETDETRALTQAMSESWLAFARTGNPNNPSVPAWKPYDLHERTVLLFDVPPSSAHDPQSAERLAMAAYPTQQQDGVLHRS